MKRPNRVGDVLELNLGKFYTFTANDRNLGRKCGKIDEEGNLIAVVKVKTACGTNFAKCSSICGAAFDWSAPSLSVIMVC